jgi:hypothetical protein
MTTGLGPNGGGRPACKTEEHRYQRRFNYCEPPSFSRLPSHCMFHYYVVVLLAHCQDIYVRCRWSALQAEEADPSFRDHHLHYILHRSQ